MLRTRTKHRIIDKEQFLFKALHWANQFDQLAYYAHNQIPYPHGGFKQILAVGAREVCLPQPEQDSFEALKQFHQDEWLFGFLGYDLKNEVEALSSKNTDRLGFPEMGFFKAKHLLFFDGDHVEVDSEDPGLFDRLMSYDAQAENSEIGPVQAGMTRDEYLSITQQLRSHIEEGDCYEINFCQEFQGAIESASPVDLFLELTRLSPKPFAAFQKWNGQYILSASPERFLKKQGNQLISQPIKGTRPRSADAEEDARLAIELRHDEKEMAENMMIVDLVRNDLARTAVTGTVEVEEMFGIYSFRQVHQMISTITAEIRPEAHFMEAIRNTFPMGSMTGAPKVKVMQLIEQYEKAKRGPFSGAAGYISPEGDFDFNVLIRSLFLDLEKMKYQYQVGSAITYDAVPEKEYEECLIKAQALCQLLDLRL